MKRIIEDTETSGMEKMLGKVVTFFCPNYIYTGRLVGVNGDHVELDNAKIVYETGSFDTTDWKDAQNLPHRWRIQTASIESWGVLK